MADEQKKTRISVTEAAKILDASPQFVRLALQQKALPIGIAVKNRRWIYLIYREDVEAYVQRPTGIWLLTGDVSILPCTEAADGT